MRGAWKVPKGRKAQSAGAGPVSLVQAQYGRGEVGGDRETRIALEPLARIASLRLEVRHDVALEDRLPRIDPTQQIGDRHGGAARKADLCRRIDRAPQYRQSRTGPLASGGQHIGLLQRGAQRIAEFLGIGDGREKTADLLGHPLNRVEHDLSIERMIRRERFRAFRRIGQHDLERPQRQGGLGRCGRRGKREQEKG